MKRMKTRNLMILMAAALFTMVSCHTKEQSKPVTLSGAGATFPQPYYTMVFKAYHEQTGNVVSYGGIGSGGGINSLKEDVVDFAGSDAYLSDEEMKDMKPVVHIPTCMGAVVIAYNLNGVQDLNLTGEVVAGIYSGVIKYWDDARIKSLNENVTLPHKKVTPVYRSDGSGTTFVFTDYLCKVSPEWSDKYGRGKSVSFPAGIAAKGNPGIAGVLSQTDGSVGYVGSEYAFARQLSYAALQNASGEFVKPSTTSISAAAQTEVPADTRCMITNSSAPGAYPISLFTWIIAYKDLNNGKRTAAEADSLKAMLEFILSDEMQALTEKIHYAPLPAKVRMQALKNIREMSYFSENK